MIEVAGFIDCIEFISFNKTNYELCLGSVSCFEIIYCLKILCIGYLCVRNERLPHTIFYVVGMDAFLF